VRAIKGLPVSPNALTALSTVVGIASGFLYAEGSWSAMLGGSFLFMIAVWMDHVDGEFARATGKTSTFGHYFDHVGAMSSYARCLSAPGTVCAIPGSATERCHAVSPRASRLR
jgi:phosphatidylglycerophosphate synthase